MSLTNKLKPVAYKILPETIIDFIKLIKAYIYQREREKRILISNIKIIDTLIKGSQPINIELGESQKRLEGWIAVDLNEASDICLNLSSFPLPFPENCINSD
ncbi:hypothetical protein [Argonema antarcticum]|uniref:hypothetical protein n=1 Tax=Argonema antarcticum TaxID=2942763 RepID=UPI0020130450|nr:hypothetical protein [Argonema antarcticum]MCL1470566.1 hypothetical protein [Argonema antarcticum A004/B2]